MLHFVNDKDQNGMALLTTLLFMQLIMLLGFYALQSSLVLDQISERHWRAMNRSVAVDEILKKVELLILNPLPDCQIPVMNSDELVANLLNGWRSPISCVGNWNTVQYDYVFEFLGEDSCAIIDQDALNSLKNDVAAYYRITLLVMFYQDKQTAVVQSTYVNAARSDKQCDGLQHTVKLGRQMWREFK